MKAAGNRRVPVLARHLHLLIDRLCCRLEAGRAHRLRSHRL